jgi:isopentenyl-diphosphate delta-isomerase
MWCSKLTRQNSVPSVRVDMEEALDPVLLEWLPVVDTHDQVVGKARRWAIHQLRLRHRAVHILVFNNAGQVYLQRRSMKKDTAPGRWDSSASGHVDSGETYRESAARELLEELQIETHKNIAELFRLPATEKTGLEFTAVYVLATDQLPAHNPEEIMDGTWKTPDEIDEWIESRPNDFASCFKEVWRSFRCK